METGLVEPSEDRVGLFGRLCGQRRLQHQPRVPRLSLEPPVFQRQAQGALGIAQHLERKARLGLKMADVATSPARLESLVYLRDALFFLAAGFFLGAAFFLPAAFFRIGALEPGAAALAVAPGARSGSLFPSCFLSAFTSRLNS